MKMKIEDYVRDLEKCGKISNGFLLTEDERKKALTLFSENLNLKYISKKDKLFNFSIMKEDESNQIFAIYNPKYDGKKGYAGGGQGLVKIAQNIITGEFCLVKRTRGDEGTIEQARDEKDVVKSLKSFNPFKGYQERSTTKDVRKGYLFMTEMPGLQVDHARIGRATFASLYESQLTDQERLIILKNLLENFQILQEEKIIHNDLTPQNILINKEDDFKVYFLDYGLSTPTGDNGQAPLKLGKKTILSANGSDFLELKETFGCLNVLINDDLKKLVSDISNQCGEDPEFKSIDITPLLEHVNTMLVERKCNRNSVL